MQTSPSFTGGPNLRDLDEEQFEALLRACEGMRMATQAAARYIWDNQGGGHSHEEIAARAYELFLARGGLPGHDLDDWLEAERQL